MAKTKKSSRRSAPTNDKRDRHAIAVVLTASGTLIAGKRRIARHVEKNGAKSVLLHEWWHFGSLPFLRVARDDAGKLRIATETTADENSWEVVTTKEARHGKA